MKEEWLPYLERRLAEMTGVATDLPPEEAGRRTRG
jgi:hypothetical protein